MDKKKQLTLKQQQIADALAILGSEAAVAARFGITRNTVHRHVKHIRNKGYERADIEDATRGNSGGLRADPREPVRLELPGTCVRVVAIGDYHDSPGQDKTRMKWIARHIETTKPDLVVQIGDMADFDSVSRHEKPGTVGFAGLPAFADDLESLEQALHEYDKILPNGPPKHITLGNHEERCLRYDNDTPQNGGLGFSDRLDQLFSRFRWNATAYGQWLFLSHSSSPHHYMGFIHIPHTLMGREYGGRTTNSICNDACFSIVMGHSHRVDFRRQAKIGPNHSVEVLALGTAMPHGLIKRYAGKSVTGWGYGIWDLTIRDGHIEGHSYISMLDLEAKYGD